MLSQCSIVTKQWIIVLPQNIVMFCYGNDLLCDDAVLSKWLVCHAIVTLYVYHHNALFFSEALDHLTQCIVLLYFKNSAEILLFFSNIVKL